MNVMLWMGLLTVALSVSCDRSKSAILLSFLRLPMEQISQYRVQERQASRTGYMSLNGKPDGLNGSLLSPHSQHSSPGKTKRLPVSTPCRRFPVSLVQPVG